MNKEKIIQVLKEEKYLFTKYLYNKDDKCKSPGHCAIGALAYAAGMTNDELWMCDVPDYSFDYWADEEVIDNIVEAEEEWGEGKSREEIVADPSTQALIKFTNIMINEYGLNKQSMSDIMINNDNASCGVFVNATNVVEQAQARVQCVIDFVRDYGNDDS